MVNYTNKPKPQSITPHAEQLLTVIRRATGWITRREIADQLDKNRLNPWEQALLRKLHAEGLIEINRRLRSDAITLEYIYRAAQQSEPQPEPEQEQMG
jgi:predicted transcriptional regulator